MRLRAYTLVLNTAGCSGLGHQRTSHLRGTDVQASAWAKVTHHILYFSLWEKMMRGLKYPKQDCILKGCKLHCSSVSSRFSQWGCVYILIDCIYWDIRSAPISPGHPKILLGGVQKFAQSMPSTTCHVDHEGLSWDCHPLQGEVSSVFVPKLFKSKERLKSVHEDPYQIYFSLVVYLQKH